MNRSTRISASPARRPSLSSAPGQRRDARREPTLSRRGSLSRTANDVGLLAVANLVSSLVLLEDGSGDAAGSLTWMPWSLAHERMLGCCRSVAGRERRRLMLAARSCGRVREGLETIPYLLGVLGAHVDLVGVIAEAEVQGSPGRPRCRRPDRRAVLPELFEPFRLLLAERVLLSGPPGDIVDLAAEHQLDIKYSGGLILSVYHYDTLVSQAE